eukprot:TRINITY_DN54930_c0_g1_i1.p1 TRINITY_DN54930_c0_g1~~TRINITY_DN54930_c0_g1_i1.p1  ORF type:complete len:583 (+),score=89.55 TRINITY_DN54930_c0_g1_i1:61-1809(+)
MSSGKAEDEQAVDSTAAPEETTSVTEITAEQVFVCARQQNFGLLKLLEVAPQHWTARDDDGHSLLHWAALVGNQDVVRESLKRGIDVNTLANNRQTPLMWAVLRGHIAVARILLDGKANLTSHDSFGATPIMIAVQHRQYPSILLLMHRGQEIRNQILSDMDKNGCTAAHWAAYRGDDTALKLLEFFGADFMALDNSKMMPIHRACFSSQATAIKFLWERKADLNARNSDGKSCMDIAQQQEDTGVQLLIKQLLKASVGKESDMDKVEESMEEGKLGEKKRKGGAFNSVMKDKSMQKAFPVFWLVCVSLAVFQYLMDLRTTGYEVAPIASLLFEIFVPLSVAIFAFVALADPGIVPPQIRGKSGVDELMKLIDSGTPEGDRADLGRLCTTTWVLKDLRTKYCTQTGACVREFDHYCVWLNCAIGRGNHRQFVMLAIVEEFAQLCHLYLLFNLSSVLVPYQNFGAWVFNVVSAFPLMALITLAHCITAPWVLMLILHQGRLIIQSLTTNEMMNMPRYEHFWEMQIVGPGRMTKVWRNPFNKGSVFKNCVDFWWSRNRSEMVAQPARPAHHVHTGQCCHGNHKH